MDVPRRKVDTFEDLGFVKDDAGSYRFEGMEIPPSPIPVLSSDVPVSRLVITHLILKNFKSYAGEQVVGPFDKNFTAVVGANGSGKSNVIDALMFVFGKKSSKIRAKKMSSLIHKSAKFPNIESCSVSVNFAIISEKDGKDCQEAAFIVTRVIFKDEKCHYEMNHKRVHLKDVVVTLRNYGIDMEYNRFLIMQGEIESISLMPPKVTPKDSTGMLEYIEDIVGSQRLVEPIQKFQAKVAEFVIQESAKATAVEMCEKEKDELEGPKNKAIAYLKLENKHTLCENKILHKQRWEAENQLKEIVEEKKKFQEEIKKLKAEMAEVHESKKVLETDMAKMASKQHAILKDREACDEKFKRLVQEDAATIQNLTHAKEKLSTAKKAMETSQKEISKLTKQLTIFESETDELQVKKKKLEEEKVVEEKKANEVMGTLKDETKKMQEQKDAREAELIKLKDNLHNIKSEIDLIKSEQAIYVSGEKKEKEKLSSLQSNLKTNVESAEKEKNLVQEEATQVKEIEKELSSLKTQLSQAKEKELSLYQQHIEARQKWEEARSSQQSSRNNSSLLNALFKAKSAGQLPAGIYGRLGNLGAIDEKYDVAMSTACGRLDNIVTDTMTTAQKCVDFLKKHNLGYATFIALDQVKQYEQQMNRKITTPENVPRLFDLLRVNDLAVLPAFYLGLFNTLVANNLEQATRIGLGGSVRYRVVTLDGKMVESTGAMIGGGNSVIRGKIGSKVVENACSDEELAEMSARTNALSRELSEVKQLCVSLDNKIGQQTSKLASLQHSLKKRSLRCNAFKEQVDMISSQIKEQEKKLGSVTIDEEKVSELDKKIKTKTKIYDKAFQETSVVEKEVSELQAKILEVSKGKYSKAKKTVDQLKKKLDEVTQAVTKSTVNIKQSKTKVKKLETKIKNIEAEIQSLEKEAQDYKEKMKDFTEEGQKCTDLLKEYDEQLGEYGNKLKEMKKDIAVINEKEQEKKKLEIEHKNKMKDHEAEEAEKNRYIKSVNSKLGKLKLTEVENDPTEMPTFTEDEISYFNVSSLLKDLDVMQVQLEDAKPNLSAIADFKKKEQVYLDKLAEYKEIKEGRILQERRRNLLSKLRYDEFMRAFAIITIKVKEIYQMLTNGGDAELELVNRRDPFEGGIQYSVRPPKKAWKSMSHLSGGEKTLSSLALVFALHYYRTTPFYVMDEIDAALDETNVGIIGKYLLEQQKNAQFIIVSLRNVMNELPDRLLGVYKIDNCTRNVHLVNCKNWNQPRPGPSNK